MQLSKNAQVNNQYVCRVSQHFATGAPLSSSGVNVPPKKQLLLFYIHLIKSKNTNEFQ